LKYRSTTFVILNTSQVDPDTGLQPARQGERYRIDAGIARRAAEREVCDEGKFG